LIIIRTNDRSDLHIKHSLTHISWFILPELYSCSKVSLRMFKDGHCHELMHYLVVFIGLQVFLSEREVGTWGKVVGGFWYWQMVMEGLGEQCMVMIRRLKITGFIVILNKEPIKTLFPLAPRYC